MRSELISYREVKRAHNVKFAAVSINVGTGGSGAGVGQTITVIAPPKIVQFKQQGYSGVHVKICSLKASTLVSHVFVTV